MGAVLGYLVTYGGLLLLGGRAGDLLGRRAQMLVAGTALLAACSLAGGLAVGAGMLVGAQAGAGRRGGHDGTGRAVDPDHQLQLGR